MPRVRSQLLMNHCRRAVRKSAPSARVATCTFSYKFEDLYVFVQVGYHQPVPSGIHAVIIADIVGSSSRSDLRGFLGKRLGIASRKHMREKRIKLPYAVTAGDEFQTVIDNLPSLPRTLLDLRAALRPLSLRVGIGLGAIPARIQAPVNRLGGEAFLFARKAIDAIKAGTLFKFEVLTAFCSPNARFDETVNLIYGLHDTLLRKITDKQWETIEQFLARPTLEHAAAGLRLDISTVSRNLKRAYYWQLLDTAKLTGSLLSASFN